MVKCSCSEKKSSWCECMSKYKFYQPIHRHTLPQTIRHTTVRSMNVTNMWIGYCIDFIVYVCRILCTITHTHTLVHKVTRSSWLYCCRCRCAVAVDSFHCKTTVKCICICKCVCVRYAFLSFVYQLSTQEMLLICCFLCFHGNIRSIPIFAVIFTIFSNC